jgi:hypothetical protein
MDQFVAVLRRALALDESAWAELRDNTSFTAVAGGLAVIAVFLAGIGAFLWGEITVDYSTPDGWFVDTVILGSLFTILLMLLGMVVAYLVLTQLFGETVAPDALFRVFSVAAVPFALGFLMFVPELNFWLAMMSVALMFFLGVFGLRAAFSIDAVRAVTAVFAGMSVFLIVMAFLISVDNRWTPGVFVLESLEDSATKSYDSTFDPDDLNLDELLPEDTGQ